MDFCSFIAGLIRRSGLTLPQVRAQLHSAGAHDVTLARVKSWSSGRRRVQPQDLPLLLDALGVGPDERETALELLFKRPEAA